MAGGWYKVWMVMKMNCVFCGEEIGPTNVIYREGMTEVPCCDECWVVHVYNKGEVKTAV